MEEDARGRYFRPVGRPWDDKPMGPRPVGHSKAHMALSAVHGPISLSVRHVHQRAEANRLHNTVIQGLPLTHKSAENKRYYTMKKKIWRHRKQRPQVPEPGHVLDKFEVPIRRLGRQIDLLRADRDMQSKCPMIVMIS